MFGMIFSDVRENVKAGTDNPATEAVLPSTDNFADMVQATLAKTFKILSNFGGAEAAGVEVSELVGFLASCLEENVVIARVESLNTEGCAEYHRRLKEAVKPLMTNPTGDIESRMEAVRKMADEIYKDLIADESEDDSAPSSEESIPEAVQALPEGVLDQDPEAELPIEARNPDVKVTINAEPDITGLLAEMDANASTEVEPVVSEPSETTSNEVGEAVEVTPEMAASIQAALGSAPKTNASHGVGRKRPTNKPKVAQSSKKTGKIRPSFKK